MSNQIELLDYEIVRDGRNADDPWQVWTPDTNGGIIGSGKTRNAAIRNAIVAMCSVIHPLCEELDRPTQPEIAP